MAPWKYPANWIAQGCWEDEINLNQIQQSIKEIMKKNNLEIASGTHAKVMSMIQETSQQTMSLNSQDKGQASKQIDRLFLIFAAFYGHIWCSLYKNESFLAFTKNEWQKGLAAFSEPLMDEAIQICRVQNERPPTLPQFIDICKAPKVREEGKGRIKPQRFVRNMIIAEIYLKKMKAILK